jgi:uncharacterized protein involved in exopolysaccharide biosynthesis
MQYSTVTPALYEERSRSFNLHYYFRLAKRRALYFLIPFLIAAAIGVALTVIQKPIYLSEGKLLVESQEIPADLVRPTVTDSAGQRIQVIQQRLLTRENLLAIVNKFGLFQTQRQWMSGTQLLELMRDRTQFQSVEVSHSDFQQKNLTLAMTLSFSYEDPQIAAKVANEFLTLVLDEDAKTRTSRAAETTKFLDRESNRLESQLGNLEAQIAELKQHQSKTGASAVETAAQQNATQLTTLKADLAQKSALYSDSHPDIKALKRKVAALEALVAKSPPPEEVSAANGLDELQKQRTSIEKNLEDANQKLSAARLGEALERNQQAERLQVIEQPTAPQKPIKPNKVKLFMASFGLALAIGLGVAFAAESLDHSVHSIEQLTEAFDRHMVSSIPFIATPADTVRSKRKITFLILVSAIILGGAAAAVYYFFQSLEVLVDKSWVDLLRSWMDKLTRLSK